MNDVPPPRRRNEARPNQPPVNDEFVYGGLGDTSEIRAASSSQLASFQATNMYKRTNRKRKKKTIYYWHVRGGQRRLSGIPRQKEVHL